MFRKINKSKYVFIYLMADAVAQNPHHHLGLEHDKENDVLMHHGVVQTKESALFLKSLGIEHSWETPEAKEFIAIFDRFAKVAKKHLMQEYDSVINNVTPLEKLEMFAMWQQSKTQAEENAWIIIQDHIANNTFINQMIIDLHELKHVKTIAQKDSKFYAGVDELKKNADAVLKTIYRDILMKVVQLYASDVDTYNFVVIKDFPLFEVGKQVKQAVGQIDDANKDTIRNYAKIATWLDHGYEAEKGWKKPEAEKQKIMKTISSELTPPHKLKHNHYKDELLVRYAALTKKREEKQAFLNEKQKYAQSLMRNDPLGRVGYDENWWDKQNSELSALIKQQGDTKAELDAFNVYEKLISAGAWQDEKSKDALSKLIALNTSDSGKCIAFLNTLFDLAYTKNSTISADVKTLAEVAYKSYALALKDVLDKKRNLPDQDFIKYLQDVWSNHFGPFADAKKEMNAFLEAVKNKL